MEPGPWEARGSAHWPGTQSPLPVARGPPTGVRQNPVKERERVVWHWGHLAEAKRRNLLF